jgi:hypothetical protein
MSDVPGANSQESKSRVEENPFNQRTFVIKLSSAGELCGRLESWELHTRKSISSRFNTAILRILLVGANEWRGGRHLRSSREVSRMRKDRGFVERRLKKPGTTENLLATRSALSCERRKRDAIRSPSARTSLELNSET